MTDSATYFLIWLWWRSSSDNGFWLCLRNWNNRKCNLFRPLFEVINKTLKIERKAIKRFQENNRIELFSTDDARVSGDNKCFCMNCMIVNDLRLISCIFIRLFIIHFVIMRNFRKIQSQKSVNWLRTKERSSERVY